MWLATQSFERQEGRMPADLRPNKSKVIFRVVFNEELNRDIIAVTVDAAYPLAYHTSNVQYEIAELHRVFNYPVFLEINGKMLELKL